MARTRSGVSTNPNSPVATVPPPGQEPPIEAEDYFDAQGEQQATEAPHSTLSVGEQPVPAEQSSAERAVPAPEVSAEQPVPAEQGSAERAVQAPEGSAERSVQAPEGSAERAVPAPKISAEKPVPAEQGSAERAVHVHETVAAEADVGGKDGVGAGGLQGADGGVGGVGELDADEHAGDEAIGPSVRRLDPFRVNKVKNAPNSRFVVNAADIKSLSPGYGISPACVNLWMEAYLPELPGCMAALEVRAATYFKELGAREGTRWLREVDVDLLTMSGEKWVPPEFNFCLIPIYLVE